MTKPQEGEGLAGLPDGERGVTVWTDPRRAVVNRVDGVPWQGENADPSVSASVERSGSPAAQPSSGPLDVERLARVLQSSTVEAFGPINDEFWLRQAEALAAEYARFEKEDYEQGMLDQAERDAEEWYGPDHE